MYICPNKVYQKKIWETHKPKNYIFSRSRVRRLSVTDFVPERRLSIDLFTCIQLGRTTP